MTETIEVIDPDRTHGGKRPGAGAPKGAGGYRPGAGRKKGQKNVKTILKEEAAAELAAKARLKQQIMDYVPLSLRKDAKALKEAIAEINEKEVEELFKKRVALHSSKLLTAMLTAAMGEQFLYKVVHEPGRGDTVKRTHVRITDPEEIQEYLDNPLLVEGDDYYYISTKSPDITAINSLLDRMMGRPTSKLVGPDNPDGSEGPIKVISLNFSQSAQVQAPVAAQPQVSGPNSPEVRIIENAVADIIEEQDK